MSGDLGGRYNARGIALLPAATLSLGVLVFGLAVVWVSGVTAGLISGFIGGTLSLIESIREGKSFSETIGGLGKDFAKSFHKGLVVS